MPDVLGYRARWGLVVPARNTVVEPELYAMVPAGITLHTSRIYVGKGVTFRNDDEFVELVDKLTAALPRAIDDVVVCDPEHLIIGLSSETFWGGRAAGEEYVRRIHEQTGLQVTTAAVAVPAALEALGARRIGVITPYQPVADAQVKGYLEECGYEVVHIHGLRMTTGPDIARQTPDVLRAAADAVDDESVDAIFQCGTNLAMTRLVAGWEAELGKPVLAINAVLLWHALRTNGFADRIAGYGQLLESH